MKIISLSCLLILILASGKNYTSMHKDGFNENGDIKWHQKN